jgi:hypothetical protein
MLGFIMLVEQERGGSSSLEFTKTVDRSLPLERIVNSR